MAVESKRITSIRHVVQSTKAASCMCVCLCVCADRQRQLRKPQSLLRRSHSRRSPFFSGSVSIFTLFCCCLLIEFRLESVTLFASLLCLGFGFFFRFLLLQLWLILKLAIKATRNASGDVVGRSSRGRGRCASSDSDSDAWLLSPAFKYTGMASSCVLSLSISPTSYLSLFHCDILLSLCFGLPAKSQCALVRAALCLDALPAAFFVRSLTCGAASNCVERVCFC